MSNYCLQDPFYNGFALVQDAETYKYGYINEQNEEIIPCVYHYGYNFNGTGENLVAVAEMYDELFGKKTGAISIKNEVLVPFEYDYVSHIHDNLYITQSGENQEDTKYGFFVPSSRFLMPLTYNGMPSLLHTSNFDFQYLTTRMEIDGMIGIVDFKGNVVVDFVYDSLFFLEEEYLLIAQKQESVAVFDKNFKKIVPENTYSYITTITDYPYNSTNISIKNFPYLLAINTQEQKGLLDLQGNVVLECIYQDIFQIYPEKKHFLVKQNDQCFAIDQKNNVVSPRKHAFIAPVYNRDVLAYSDMGDIWDVDFKYGFMTADFEVLTECIFSGTAQIISDIFILDYVLVATKETSESLLKYGLYHLGQKKLVIPCQFDSLTSWEMENYIHFVVRNEELYGAYDQNFKEIFPPKYKNIETVSKYSENGENGEMIVLGFIVENAEGRKGVVNLEDKAIIPLEYHGVFPNYTTEPQKNAFVVEKAYFYDQKGIIKHPLFDTIRAERYANITMSDGLIEVANKEGLYGAINTNLELVIPCLYSYALIFSEGLAIASLEGKMGVINTKNEVIVPFEYSYPATEKYKDGFVLLADDNGGVFAFDTQGKKITEYSTSLSYKGLGVIVYSELQNDNYVTIFENLHTRKKTIVENGYDMEDFYHGIALCVNRTDYPYKYMYLNTDGEPAFDVNFGEIEEMTDFFKGYARIKIKTEEGQNHIFINPKGEIVAQFPNWRAECVTENAYLVIDSNGRKFVDAKGNTLVEGDFLEDIYFLSEDKIILQKDITSNNTTQEVIYDLKTKQITEIPYMAGYPFGVYQENGKDFVNVWRYNPDEYVKGNYLAEYGFMDLEGNIMLALQYNQVFPFRFGLSVVKKGDLSGVINTKNEIIVPFEYTQVTEFNGAFGIAIMQEDKILEL